MAQHMMSPPKADKRGLRIGGTSTLLVVLLGLVLSVFAWITAAAWEDQKDRGEFATQAGTKLTFLKEGVIDFHDVMRSYYGAIEGSGGRPDAKRLDEFAKPLLAEYTGTSDLAWAARVWGSGADRYPILFATHLKTERAVTGFDLGSVPPIRATLDRARDRGELVVSPVIPLPIAAGKSGVAAVRAVYSGATQPSSVEERRRELIGFAMGAFLLGPMVDGTVTRLTAPAGLHIYIYSNPAVAGDLPVYVHTSRLAKSPAPMVRLGALESGLHMSGVVTFGNRSWLAVLIPYEDRLHGLWGLPPLSVFALSLILSALATVYTWQAGRQHQREIALGLAARAAKRRLKMIYNSVNDGVFLSDPERGSFVEVNDVGCRMFGYAPGELLGCTIVTISSGIPPYTQESVMEAFVKAQTGPQMFEWQGKRKDGSLFWTEVSLSMAPSPTGDLGLAVVRDITERKRASEQITQMAHHDLLTGLANRGVFVKALDQAMARAQRRAGSFALLYLDLDHFKNVNDTLGHPAGDLLLESVAHRLRASVRATDTVARFGGDEFAILLSDIADSTDAADAAGLAKIANAAGDVAAKILAAVKEPFFIQGKLLNSGASVGIALYERDGANAESMLSRADQALYRAKSEGRGTYRFFTDAMDAEVRARVTMSAELREAISSDQLFLHYQPQVDINTRRIVGLEALVRWHHPTRGDLGPDAFIAAAEANGLIVPLGRWVMREACRQAKQWCDAGIAPPVLAINISGVQFKMPLELEREIAATLAEFPLSACRLELELTESVLMHSSQDHNALLLRWRNDGIRIAIDDFGTGYSSLDYLRRYPVDRIKIANTFTADIGKLSGTDAIVRAALGLARELGSDVVVEGAETRTQVDLLRAWGCRTVQGYYYSKPLSAADATRLLRIGKISPADTTPAELLLTA